MAKVLDELVKLLALEKIEENLFRGQSQDLGWGTVFGGQVLGQALSAAVQTVPAERAIHSLHAYFLRPGDVHRPIVYDVDRIRDGSSFTTRRVVAIQNGKAIFNMSASFQKHEPGFEHQDAMPDVPPPEALKTEQELIAESKRELPELLPHARDGGAAVRDAAGGSDDDPFVAAEASAGALGVAEGGRSTARRSGAASVSARLRLGPCVHRHGAAAARRDLVDARNADRQRRSRDVVPSAVPRRRVAPARDGFAGGAWRRAAWCAGASSRATGAWWPRRRKKA